MWVVEVTFRDVERIKYQFETLMYAKRFMLDMTDVLLKNDLHLESMVYAPVWVA